MNSLPNDIARCSGVHQYGGGLREECIDCRRRTSPAKGEYTEYLSPPPSFVSKCNYWIAPEWGPDSQ